MASVTYDGRSFMLDGRRIWLVGGSIMYGRVCRQQWAERIHAAKLAGLNTIETAVLWNRHEPRPGKHDFQGDNDLAHFIKLVGDAGMHCVLRLGPFVGDEVDLGGLPAWVLDLPGVKLRTANGAFLEAYSRFLGAVADQVRDLQVTSTARFPGGGPLVLVQSESRWTCGDETLAHQYLGELGRYIREAGLNVPIINANNLWQGVEGEIDGWSGREDLLAITRQLASVRPDQPRVVIDFGVGRPLVWGDSPKDAEQTPPWLLQRRLAEVLAGGGQFNVNPFCGGTNFGFWGGRQADRADGFVATSNDRGAPLSETGTPGPSYPMLRRLATFASRFGKVFSHLDPAVQPVLADPSSLSGDEASPRCAIAHVSGAQGAVAFVMTGRPGREMPGSSFSTTLLLPEGVTLPIELGEQAVGWCLLDVHISGRAHLDYCTLNAFAAVGSVLVCFGPAGSRGQVAVNGSPLELIVPAAGKQPVVAAHEGLTIVVVNEQQIDSTYATDEAVYVGVEGVTPDGRPVVAHGVRSCLRLAADGSSSTLTVRAGKTDIVVRPAPSTPRRPALAPWTRAATADYAAGKSARYAAINGPMPLSVLGCPYGYGWYRLGLKQASGRSVKVMAPGSGDRLHFFLDGKDAGVLGAGPGAADQLTLPLRKGSQSLVVLAETLGRASGGTHAHEPGGLAAHLWEVKPLRTAKPKIVEEAPLEVLAFRSPLWEVRSGEGTSSARLTWAFTHRRTTGVIISVRGWPASLRAIVLLNGKGIEYIDGGGPRHIALTPEQLSRGVNRVQLALVGDDPHAAEEDLRAVAKCLVFHEAVASVSAKAEWGFAKWEPPMPTAFQAPAGAEAKGGPAWWRSSFTPAPLPPGEARTLLLDLAGMTKGQVYLNGRHVGRYFVAAGDRRALGTQGSIILPEPWLKHGVPNDLAVFDEHGAAPTRARLFYDAPTR